MNTTKKQLILFSIILTCCCYSTHAQKASIKENLKTIKTYPFSDPNKIPILADNPKIYPYFKFEGYSQNSQEQNWKVITLENDYIKTWVLPEVGGKVWGAIEKASGQPFIYHNEVMKFRNIAMRGPWTSGGIEFNFGIIGHSPATATPVDYLLEEHDDGSVSCVVGAMDLPSRTHWRVRIKLPKDKAYFETEALWYNPTPLNQSYYNWMTAAAAASEDLTFYYPGDEYLTHPGDARPYPIEYGRNISKYNENDFLDSKSYHVVGDYNDFFGGYYSRKQYGFGHWALYDEMPGQKLWIWALSRAGGIWEDLLTDTNGQYIEFQAGRLFNQYAPSTNNNPISQVGFTPHTSDQWRELWFPVLGIGGLSDVSPNGILYVVQEGKQLSFGINALTASEDTLKIYADEKLIYEKKIDLLPLAFFKDSIQIYGAWTIELPKMGLKLQSDSNKLRIARPFQVAQVAQVPVAELKFRAGVEALVSRDYQTAQQALEDCLKENPAHLEALAYLAECYYANADYDQGLQYALLALTIDTYHPQANYVAGILYKAKGDYINAKEMLGWAARSMNYRSAAYALMSEITLAEQELDLALHYATKALDFNRFNILAYQVLILANRLRGNSILAKDNIKALLKIDPLCHFARYEQYLLEGTDFQQYIQNEFPYQTYLELAMDYYHKAQYTTAIQILENAPKQPLVNIWLAYLKQSPNLLDDVVKSSTDFVFPYRNETLEALTWANQQRNHWKLKYYLGLLYWSKNKIATTKILFESIGQEADNATFYLTRAKLRQEQPQTALQDLEKALKIASNEWRTHQAIVQHFQKQQDYSRALNYSLVAIRQHPNNYALSLLHVKSLIFNQQYASAIEQLNKTEVLPFEGAYEGRQLYEWAHYGQALALIAKKEYQQAIMVLEQSKQWPERLGVGQPYHPDDRMANYLLAHVYQKLHEDDKANNAQAAIVAYTLDFPLKDSYLSALGWCTLPSNERNKKMIALFPNPDNLPEKLRWSVYQVLGYPNKATINDSNDLTLKMVKIALLLE